MSGSQAAAWEPPVIQSVQLVSMPPMTASSTFMWESLQLRTGCSKVPYQILERLYKILVWIIKRAKKNVIIWKYKDFTPHQFLLMFYNCLLPQLQPVIEGIQPGSLFSHILLCLFYMLLMLLKCLPAIFRRVSSDSELKLQWSYVCIRSQRKLHNPFVGNITFTRIQTRDNPQLHVHDYHQLTSWLLLLQQSSKSLGPENVKPTESEVGL